MELVPKAAVDSRLDRFHEQRSQFSEQQKLLEKAWIRFEDAGFKPLLIKGWAAALCYDRPWMRSFSDIDFMVAANQCAEAKDLVELEELFFVDLHCGPRLLDTLTFEELFAASREARCGETLIRIPRPEDHLRILAVHWLLDGGAYKHRLWDIYHLLTNRADDFDWSRCLGVVSARRRFWIECVIGLAGRYFDLDLSDTPIPRAAERIPNWVIRTIEREWASEVKLQPIHRFLNDPRGFVAQVRKRIPPNPIQATVELEGDFEKYPRAVYQIANIFTRSAPSISRVGRTLARRIFPGIKQP